MKPPKKLNHAKRQQKRGPQKAKKKPRTSRSKEVPQLAPHQFKPGQSGNPLGGKLHNPELRMLKTMTKEELARVGDLVVRGDYEALQLLAQADDAPVITRCIASVCDRIIRKGDMAALDVLLNRLIGKVKDELDFNSTNPPQIVVTLPSNGREAG